MNFFDFFQLPVSFLIDEAALKKAYYANSKKYHPDFYTLEPAEKQNEILELSTLNNEAYQTLADPDRRLRYLLDIHGAIAEEGNNDIPQDFLMDMMDINEAIMDLEFDFDPEKLAQTQSQLEKLEKELYDEIFPVLQSFDAQSASLPALKEYYFKKKYLLRIRENLSKFATH